MASTSDVTTILLQMLVLLVASKGGGALARMLGSPTVVGEILGGVVVGNSVLAHELGFFDGSDTLRVLAELGVVFLLFEVGLETPLSDLTRVGTTSLFVAVLGVVVPLVSGILFAWAMGWTSIEGAFFGAALVATSVGITARVLADIGLLRTEEARIILGAAVVDDVLGLVVLSVVQSLGMTGSIEISRGVLLLLEAVAFVGIVAYFGPRVAERATRTAERAMEISPQSEGGSQGRFAVALVLLFALSALAGFIGLAAIIGAFLAGVAFAGTKHHRELYAKFRPIGEFLTPFFFAFVGLHVNLHDLLGVGPLVLVATLLAILTKLVGCGAGALGKGAPSALAVGVGMVPRGEVGIVVALVGLGLEVISSTLYSLVVALSVLTTLVSPPLIVWAFRRIPSHRTVPKGSTSSPDPPPPEAPQE